MPSLSPTQLRTLALMVVDPVLSSPAAVHVTSGALVRDATMRRLIDSELSVEEDGVWVVYELGLLELDRAADDGTLSDGVLEEQIAAAVKAHLRTIRPVR